MKILLPVYTSLLLSFFATISLQDAVPQSYQRQAPAAQSLTASDSSQDSSRDLTNTFSNSAVAADPAASAAVQGIENAFGRKYKLYPVPALSELTVEGTDDVTLIEIYDVTGNKIISESSSGENIKHLHVSHLVRGIYFVRLSTGHGAVMKRFIKE